MREKDRILDQTSVRRFGSIDVRHTDRAGAIADLREAIDAVGPRMFSFCSAATINLAHENATFVRCLERFTLFNDGVGIDIASKILYGNTFTDNLNGTDLVPALFASLTSSLPVFLVGSPPGVAEKAGAALSQRYPFVEIVGSHHGYFSLDETPDIADAVRASGARLVLVGMGQPRQEFWSAEVAQLVDATFLCVGAYMDFASGRMPRAPRLVRAARIEWLYRLMLEPRRLSGRYILGALPYFSRIFAQRFGR